MGLDKALPVIRRCAYVASALWLIAQVVVIIYYWDCPQFSDANNYAVFAREAVDSHSWYPTVQQFSYAWVANTGYINFLVLNLYMFGTLAYIPIFQLLFNILLAFSIFLFVRRYAGECQAYVALIFFCVLPSNVFDVVTRMSDLACCALFALSIVMLRKSGIGIILVAGMLAAVANWIRPIGAMFWPAIFLYWLFTLMRTRKCVYIYSYAIPYILGVLIVNSAIMAITYHSCGHALAGSTTKGTNMIMGCNDLADGGYNDAVFREGQLGYISPDSVVSAPERDRILTQRSVDWVLAHPGKFAKLAPVKMMRLWVADHYAYKVLESPDDTQPSTREVMLWSVTYYLLLAMALVGIWMCRHTLLSINGAVLLALLLGCGMHMVMYGGMRYHYPMMLCLYFFAAIGVCGLIAKRTK